MNKFAHFEAVMEPNVFALYTRHAQVARDIHEQSLREFTGNNELVVELVRENALSPDDATLDLMAQYDSISVSSGIALGGVMDGVMNERLVDYRIFFENDAPIYTVAADNKGRNGEINTPRIADFSRTSLVVGEANFDENGVPFIEEHSSLASPTLAANSPFNNGIRFQYYDFAPSLEGHEDLIGNFLYKREFERRYAEDILERGYESEEDFQNAEGANAVRDFYYDFLQKLEDEDYREIYLESEELKAQVQHYLDQPNELHDIIRKKIIEGSPLEVDENGFLTGMDGTSFSAPYLAGFVSGALHEQSLREDQGLPTLTKEEISSLARMATIDVNIREGQAGFMETFTNSAGFAHTNAGGHGVFNPEMFRVLLDETYANLEANPEIDREPITVMFGGIVDKGQEGLDTARLKLWPVDGNPDIIERIHIKAEWTGHRAAAISEAILEDPNGEKNVIKLMGTSGFPEIYEKWARIEADFGETLADDARWGFTPMLLRPDPNDPPVYHNLIFTIHGYKADSLMHQMMDRSKELAPEFEAKPGQPVQEPAMNTTEPAMSSGSVPSG